MEGIERIKEIADAKNGFFSQKDCAAEGISRWQVASLMRQGKVRCVKFGVYALSNEPDDELRILQMSSKKLLFSHGTALHLLGFSDQSPHRLEVSVPVGYNSAKIRAMCDVHQVSPSIVEIGVAICKTSFGNDVRVSCVERALCEMLHRPSRLDKERFFPAFQKYVVSKEKNVLRLLEFAKIFRVEKKITAYLEALQ